MKAPKNTLRSSAYLLQYGCPLLEGSRCVRQGRKQRLPEEFCWPQIWLDDELHADIGSDPHPNNDLRTRLLLLDRRIGSVTEPAQELPGKRQLVGKGMGASSLMPTRANASRVPR